MRIAKAFIVSVLLGAIICGSAFAQAEIDKKIRVIRVKENKAISTAVILSKIKTKIGDVFSYDIINDDLKRLYSLGFFTDISIDVADYEDGIAITFIVEEKPVIRNIVFEGNEALRDTHLKKEMLSKEGEMLDPSMLSRDAAAVKKFYEKKGFHMAEVSYSTQIDEEKNSATITMAIDERRTTKIKHIFFEGNEHYKDKEIKALITTRPDNLFNSGFFQADVFEEDLEKIKAYYQREGYLDAAVDNEYDYYEDNKHMDITVIIEEGKKYLVGDITIAQNNVFTQDEIKEVLEMKRNTAFSQEWMRVDAMHIQEIYYNKGYIMCRVYPEPVVNKDTGRIDIAYNLNENDLIHVGRVEIAGNSKTKDIVIRRELRVFPGKPFSGEEIKRSKERLYNLGYFEDLSFDTKETDDPATRDLVVNVKETKTGEFSFGGGYSSIDKLIGFASVSQRNFDIKNFPNFTGGGQDLTVRGEFGFVRSNYLISWTDPWIMGLPYSFGFDLYRTTHSRNSDAGYGWEEERWGGSTTLGKDFNDYFSGETIYRMDRVDISDVAEDVVSPEILEEEGVNYLSSLGGYLMFDTRDNVFNPKKGMILRGGIENAGGIFFGDIDFIKFTGSSSFYKTVFDKFVFEFRSRIGLVTEYADSERVPVYERFFAGGGKTIRGYSERGVGPRDAMSGIPIGGESLVVNNLELTFPIFEKLIKGAVFYDMGNVWEAATDIGFTDYKHGAGVGVRVKTPIGPVQLDWGYPFTEVEDEEQKGRFYFSVSHGF